jgi:hypothetical protein
MASNLTGQVRSISLVTKAVASGDLGQKVDVDVKGEMLDLKNTINDMVSQLNIFASEVTRVALEVGTEGKLGGQALVKGVQGTWKDLTENVNVRTLFYTVIRSSSLLRKWRSTSPTKSGRSPTSPPLSPVAISPRRSRSMSRARCST